MLPSQNATRGIGGILAVWENIPPYHWVETTIRTNGWARVVDIIEESEAAWRWNAGLDPLVPAHVRLAKRILADAPDFLAKVSSDHHANGAWAHLALGQIDETIAFLKPMAHQMIDERPDDVSDTYQPPMDALKLLVLAHILKGDTEHLLLARRYLVRLRALARGVDHQDDANRLERLLIER